MSRFSTKMAKYAHLMPFGKKAEDEEEEKVKRAEEEEEDAVDGKKAEEEEDENHTARKAKKAKRAEQDDEDDSDAESEDDESDAEDDEDNIDAEEDEEDKTARRARKAERDRCKAIFSTAAAGSNPAMAAFLAFDSNMTSKEAIGVLKTASMGNKKTSLYSRMEGVKNYQVGGDKAAMNLSDQIVAVGRRVRGK